MLFGFDNKYPYTDFHELNLDWILSNIFSLSSEMKTFVSLNTIKYADPLQWDITKQYEKNTIVQDSSGNTYLSKQAVPTNIALSNTDYWLKVADFSISAEEIRHNIAALDEGSSIFATQNISKDQLVWLNEELYQALIDIPAGSAFVYTGTPNVQKVTVEDVINTFILNLKNAITTADDGTSTTTSANRTAGDLVWLDNILYEVLSNMTAGDTYGPSNVQAVDIDDLLRSIRQQLGRTGNISKPEYYGAIGDGVADDTRALQDCINDNSNKLILLTGSYKITSPITMNSHTHIYGQGGKIIDACDHITAYTGVFQGDNVEDVIIENVNFTGENLSGSLQIATLYSDSLIQFNDSKDLYINNCLFTGITKGNCIIFKRCDNCEASGNTIKYFQYCAIGGYDGTTKMTVSNNKILNSRFVPASYGNCYRIVLSGYSEQPYTQGSNCKAIGNYIDDDLNGMWEGIDTHGGSNMIIADNVINNIDNAISCVSNITDSSRPIFQCSNIKVSNNIINGPTTPSIYTDRGSQGIIVSGVDCSVVNNLILNIGKRNSPTDIEPICAIMVSEISRRCVITNNEISQCNGIGIGFILTNNSVAQVANNMIRIEGLVLGQAYDVFFHNGTHTAIRINNNTIASASPAYRFPASASGVVVNDNEYVYAYPTQTNIEYAKPDVCEASQIGSITVGTIGDRIRCINPAPGGYAGYIRTSGNTWKGYGLIQA